MEKHNLDELFTNKLADLEQTPSPSAWDEIEETLNQESKRNIWPWIGIAASAALVIASSWYMLSSDTISTVDNYTYADVQHKQLNVPTEVIFVPVIIQVTYTPAPEISNRNSEPVQLVKVEANNALDIEEPVVTIADNNILDHSLTPIIKEPLPLENPDSENIAIASTKNMAPDAYNTREPLTIIYKQGEPEHKSKFTQALTYMGDVRNGDKKLVNFGKIKKSFQSKIKSNKNENSK